MVHITWISLLRNCVADYNERSSHTSVIRRHYVFLLETLDVKFSKLVCQLYSGKALNEAERDDIVAEKTSFRANEMLLSVLSRKSQQQFQLFLDALDNCGQQHVRNVIDERRPGLSITQPRTICDPFVISCLVYATFSEVQYGSSKDFKSLKGCCIIIGISAIRKAK